MQPALLVIGGPTGSGKTALAIRMAQALKCSVISADSRQVFRELRIGSAAPSEQELLKVPHYFVGNKSISEPFNAGVFASDALELLQERLFNECPVQIVCGGSGLYIKALTEGMDNLPAVAPEIREELVSLYKNEGIGVLQDELRQSDPDYYQMVDQKNPQRLIRALEIIRSTGKPYSVFRKNNKPDRPFDIYYFMTELTRNELYERINHRTHNMMHAGWLEEAIALKAYRSLNALQTVGYKELFAFMDGDYPFEEAVNLIQQNTRRFAKRQITWFKNQFNPDSIHPDIDISQISILTNIRERYGL